MPTFETPEPIVVTLDLPHGSVRIVASDRRDTHVVVAGEEGTEAEDRRASQRAPASEERSRAGSRASGTEAEDRRASQRAPASEERSRAGSRASGTEAEDRRASQRAPASEERSRAGSRASGTEAKARIEFVGGQLLIKGHRQRRLGRALDWLRRSEPLDIEIELPTGSRIHGKLAMGDFRCEGSLGECRLTTDYGDIRLDEGGPVQLATIYGEIHVDRAVGHTVLSTGAGEVRVREIDGTAAIQNNYGETRVGEVTGDLRVEGLYGEVRIDRAHAGITARTAYGSVRIREVARGVVELSTTSGELEIGIRSGTAAWLDVISTAGRVRNSLETHDSPEGFTDTVEIRARTHDGDILIRRA